MRATGFVLTLALVLPLGQQSIPAGRIRSIVPVVLDQTSRHPRMEPADIYKLVYQAAMGNEHFMADTSEMMGYLVDELKSVEADTSEPLEEIISPDSMLVRLNLRPFKARGGDPRSLLSAMVQTSNGFEASRQTLVQWLEELRRPAAATLIGFSPDSLAKYFQQMRSSNYPAAHHSKQYETAYRPAYRVIFRRLAGNFLRYERPAR